MPANDRVIVGCRHGEEEPDGVVVSYLTAGAELDQGRQVVMWLTSDGVRLALRGYGDPIRADLEPPVNQLPDTLREALVLTEFEGLTRSRLRAGSRSRCRARRRAYSGAGCS